MEPMEHEQYLILEEFLDKQTPYWGMNNAVALPQHLLRMPEEEYRHQGSWEQNWGFDNAILLSQQPQGIFMEGN